MILTQRARQAHPHNQALRRQWLRCVFADSRAEKPVLIIHGARARWGNMSSKEANFNSTNR